MTEKQASRAEREYKNRLFLYSKLKVQAGETKLSGRGNWSFKRGKLKFHTQETLGEKQDGKDRA